MAESHVIAALVKKRAELAGQLRSLDNQRKTFRSQLSLVDNTLKLFEYKGNPCAIKPRRPHRRLFRRNELRQMALEIGRRATQPMTYRDIAEAVILRKGWTVDSELVERVTNSIAVTMRLIRKRRPG